MGKRSGEDIWVVKGKQRAAFELCAPETHLLPPKSVVGVKEEAKAEAW